MKKTTSLLGLLPTGVALLANPQTGIFYAASAQATLDIAGFAG